MVNDTESDEPVTISDVVEAAEAQIDEEIEGFEGGELPDHADRLLVQRAADLQKTMTNITIASASDSVDLEDDEIAAAVEEKAVEIVMAVGALAYEYDMDLAEAMDDRLDLMQALREAETEEEQLEALIGEDAMEEMGGPNVGDDVSRDDYEGEPRGFS